MISLIANIKAVIFTFIKIALDFLKPDNPIIDTITYMGIAGAVITGIRKFKNR